jgi:acyl carrier protein
MEMDKQICKYVAENLLSLDDGFEDDNDASFIGEGLVDSTGVMQLVSYVQSEFDIAIDPHEVTPDNFDSVNKRVSFIQAMQIQSAN